MSLGEIGGVDNGGILNRNVEKVFFDYFFFDLTV
jgi:hypothetical protein